MIIYLLALLLSVRLDWRLPNLVAVVLVVVLGASFFSTFSLIIACLVKTRERFMGIGQVLTMPLFFASNAIYPIALMPNWLKVVSQLNPLTYEVDALRDLMVVGGATSFGLVQDFAVLILTTAVAIAIGAWLYPRVVR